MTKYKYSLSGQKVSYAECMIDISGREFGIKLGHPAWVLESELLLGFLHMFFCCMVPLEQ